MTPSLLDVLGSVALRMQQEGTTYLPEWALTDVPGVDGALSAGLLVLDGERIFFAHEALRDHAAVTAFTDSGVPLVDELQRRRSDLSARDFLRQVLTARRIASEAGFATTVRELLAADDLRFMLRDVVFDVLKADAAPLAELWPVIERLVLDPAAEGHHAAWSIAVQAPWLQVADHAGLLLRLLGAQDEDSRNVGITLLRHMRDHDPSRAATLLRAALPLLGNADAAVSWVVHSRAEWTEDLARLMVDLAADGSVGIHDDFWMAVHDLPSAQPGPAADVLGAFLSHANAQQRVFGPEQWSQEHYWFVNYVKAVGAAAPLRYARAMLPVVIRAVSEDAGEPDEDGERYSLLFEHMGRNDEGPAMAVWTTLVAAMERIAQSHPRSVPALAGRLLAVRDVPVLRVPAYRAWAANPEHFASTAIAHLTQTSPAPFRAPETNDYDATAKLLIALSSRRSRELAPLERAILDYRPRHERGTSFGRATYLLLQALPTNKLSDIGRGRLDELARKFHKVDLNPPRFIAGVVGSPIEQPQAKKMNDAAWLRAMRRYGEHERGFTERDGRLVGGAVELSRVLEAETKASPGRFARLATRLPAGVHPAYVGALLMGLGDTDQDVDVDLVFAALRHVAALPGRPGVRWIDRPIRSHASAQIPDDILDLVSDLAMNHPDPDADEDWPDASTKRFPDNPHAAGINSVRGRAADALADLIWHDAERISRLHEAAIAVSEDRTLAVRTCAANVAFAALRHDVDFAADLAARLFKGTTPRFATLAPPERLLYRLVGPAPGVVERVQAALLDESNTDYDARRVGGRLAAYSALFGERSPDEPSEILSDGAPAEREGVTNIAAANARDADPAVRACCADWLRQAFTDRSETVRTAAASWTRHLDDHHIAEMSDLASNFIASPAFVDDNGHFVHVLDDCNEPLGRLALEAAARFVGHYGSDVGDLRRGAAVYAGPVSQLALRAYASAATVADREQALDVLDRLLALRVGDAKSLLDAPG